MIFFRVPPIQAVHVNMASLNIKIIEPDVDIYLTGGGVYDLEKFLEFSYVYHKNLVLDGLELFANNMG